MIRAWTIGPHVPGALNVLLAFRTEGVIPFVVKDIRLQSRDHARYICPQLQW